MEPFEGSRFRAERDTATIYNLNLDIVMTGQEFLDIPSNTIGIYLFTNKINNKSYVGQSLDIRRRFNKHMLRMRNHWNYPLYNALNKYGLENFDYSILETITSNKTVDIKELTKKLNDLEVFYIQKYDSFNNGYNLTVGGESIAGYKFSEEACEKRKEISKEIQNDGRNKVLVYNIETKEYLEFLTLTAFLKSIGSKSRHAATNTIVIKNKWIVARNKEELENKIQIYNNQEGRDRGKFIPKIDFSEELKSDLQTMEWAEFCTKYKVTKGTYYNYLHKFGIKTKVASGKDPRKKVTEEQFINVYKSMSRDELCSKLGISQRRYYELCKKYKLTK